MGRYSFAVDIAASREQVFALWTNLERLAEWTEGATRVSDATGPSDQPGSRYRIWTGGFSTTAEVVAAERPVYIRTRIKAGSITVETSATFEARDGGTRLRQSFTSRGIKSAIWARILSLGSYPGSFRAELLEFARVAKAEATATGLGEVSQVSDQPGFAPTGDGWQQLQPRP